VTLQWNLLEESLDQFIWCFVGFDYEFGRMITGRIGNASKTDLLLDLANFRLSSAKFIGHIEHAVTCFHICRENRNIIAHSMAIEFYGREGWLFGKRSKSKPANWSGFRFKVSDIRRVQNEIVTTDTVMRRLIMYRLSAWAAERAPWERTSLRLPRKPRLPRRIDPLPPEALPDDWRPR
jgi:hypothetical protein